MCVVSNIGDHYGRPDGWPWQPVIPTVPTTIPKDFRDIWREHVENAEIADLKKRVEALEELLRKGKEYDAATGQPDCELDEKKEALRKLAEQLGVEIEFPE